MILREKCETKRREQSLKVLQDLIMKSNPRAKTKVSTYFDHDPAQK